jgi:hypothetical protein
MSIAVIDDVKDIVFGGLPREPIRISGHPIPQPLGIAGCAGRLKQAQRADSTPERRFDPVRMDGISMTPFQMLKQHVPSEIHAGPLLLGKVAE